MSQAAKSRVENTQIEAKSPIRVIAYVDGYNLYHGIRSMGWRHYYWLDIPAMVRAILKPGQTLSRTKYFTSRAKFPADTIKRQNLYLEALCTLPNLDLIEGRYDGEVEPCDKCQHGNVWHNEKMTDVNIAVQIARDAYEDAFDTAFLVTGDSDQVPTVRMVNDLWPGERRIVCAFPPNRVSRDLQNASRGRFTFINEVTLRACQLPERVVKADGYVLVRPERWASTKTVTLAESATASPDAPKR